MNIPSTVVFIENAPADPAEMFSNLIKAFKTANPNEGYIPMNVATIDDEFGVLNRTMVYKCLEDGHIIFTTENNSIKYENLVKDPRISVIFLFNIMQANGINSIWQVRLIGNAVELSPDQVSNLWVDEPVYAKVRSRISVCGKPVDFAQHKNAYDKLLKEYENGQDSLPQSKIYTGFKIIPIVWDFYKSEPNCVADRIQYRKEQSGGEKWTLTHVAS